MGAAVILLLLALAVYERETVAAIAFASVLLLCIQPSYSPPVISDVHEPMAGSLGDVMTWDGSDWVDRPGADGQVLTSSGADTYTLGETDYNRSREQHRDSARY